MSISNGDYVDLERLEGLNRVMPLASELQKLREAIIEAGGIEDDIKFGQCELFALKVNKVRDINKKVKIILKMTRFVY